MEQLYLQINRALYEADIEGLREVGAPDDEYESEARSIATQILALPAGGDIEPTIIDIIAKAWRENFDLDRERVLRRQSAFESLSREIVNILLEQPT